MLAQMTVLERKIIKDAEATISELCEAVADARFSRKIPMESIRDTYILSLIHI